MDKKLTVEDLEMTSPRRENGGPASGLSLCRSFSLRAPDPSSQLASAYRNQDLETFSELLSGSPPEVDPDHWFDDPNFATMLDLAARDDGRAEYVRVLLEAGADPNRVNRVRKKAPLHLAAEAGNAASLEQLLQAKGLDVNKQDSAGCTALHLAAKEDAAHDAQSGRGELQHRYRRWVHWETESGERHTGNAEAWDFQRRGRSKVIVQGPKKSIFQSKKSSKVKVTPLKKSKKSQSILLAFGEILPKFKGLTPRYALKKSKKSPKSL
ncbi:uncharacterized protein LOC117651095 [Thrips palmi]|uniref:Uncharacterized protein LOC117651095 n=1 Tax=Thrips palmi TaxID=161013 RepID=A0A6P9A1K2_THRPL|nr:uncharacterized protein LOC117651095 [Thrips palmi]